MRSVSLVLFAILAISLVNVCQANTNADFKAFVSQKLLQMGAQLSLPFMLPQIQNAPIPDQEMSAVGIHLNLRNIKLSGCSFASDAVTLIPSDSLQLAVNGFGCKANMDWEYKDGPLIDFKGTADDTLADVNFGVTVEFLTDGNGHPLPKITNTNIDIGTLNIELHGDGASLFTKIANFAVTLLKGTLQTHLSSIVTEQVNEKLVQVFANFAFHMPLFNHSAVTINMLPSTAFHGLKGTHYSNNHFGGSSSDVTYNALSISVGAYHSVDISGFVKVDVSGRYSMQLHHTQRGLIEFAGQQAGKLEMWNVGMCWPQHNTETTSFVTLQAGQYYPLRVRYQSGCGGGSFDLNLCTDTNGCVPLPILNTMSDQVYELPFEVSPSYLSVAMKAAYENNGQAIDYNPIEPLPLLPSQPLSDSMISLMASQHTINNLLLILTKENVLQKIVMPEDIPADPSMPFHLNTNDLAFFFPDLAQLYPNHNLSLYITITPNMQPTVSLSATDGLQIYVPGRIAFNVLHPTATDASIFAFSIDIAALVQMKITFDNNKHLVIPQVVSVSNTKLSLADANQQVFPNPSTLLQTLQGLDLGNIINMMMLPQINKSLGEGFAIPKLMEVVVLANMDLQINDDFLVLHTDIAIDF